ncbi:MAG: efflux RND transporter periplasmic adaptor subunit [Porticoccaceae bacterium]|nr:efflux RND transporter periplasmic adaptor subunit [Porticoccaceae bacterium]
MRDKLLAIGVVAAALFVAVMMNLLAPGADKSPEPEAAIAVKTMLVKSADLAVRVESQGVAKARTKTSLVSEVSGAVLRVSDNFVVGGTFQAGDMLMALDPTDYEVALQRAEARLMSVKAAMEFERARSVQAAKEWAMTGRPQSEAPLLALRRPYLLEAEANLLQAQSEVRQAKIKLEKTVIKAPYAGMVANKLADVGQFVTAGTRVGEAFAIDYVEVRLPLTERDLSMMGSLLSQNLTDKTVLLSGAVDGINTSWQATIVRSEGVVSELNRAQYLVARLADPYGLKVDQGNKSVPLRVGTFVKASIEGKVLKDVFQIPRSALLEGSRVGLIDSEQLLKIVSVTVAHADDQYYYLSNGLTEGMEIVISALGTPIEGLKLRVRNDLTAGTQP